jgi:hypothetical protein
MGPLALGIITGVIIGIPIAFLIGVIYGAKSMIEFKLREFLLDCFAPIPLEHMRVEGYFRRRAALKALYTFNRIERATR